MLAFLIRISKRSLVGATGAGAVALLTLAAAPAALAEDEEETFEQGIIRSLLGGGSKPGIEYRERSPLVIPPGRDLPAPDGGKAIEATASWPRDPDQRKRASSGRAAPAIDGARSEARHLRPDELRRGSAASANRDNRPHATQSDNDQGRPLRPAEYGETRSLLNFFASKPPQPETFQGEPARARMTDPPAGYRTPTPGQPYQAPKEAAGSWFKPLNIFDRGTQ